MCGICGWIQPGLTGAGADRAAAATVRMTDLLHHRGPDDCGLEDGDGWGLGFRRLSILDLTPLGHQPMASPDGRYRLVFNGEIYNYLELRRDLERAGERFRGGSDTEVLLRLLMRKGAGALPLLNGMFALAFIDTRARTFLLARDRMGVKPLYYRIEGASLRFASELKALAAWPDAPRAIDPTAVAQYLALGYLPSETCIFLGYAKLAPACTLSGSLDSPARARCVPYWDLALNDDPTRRPITTGETDELEALLTDAVRIRLRSDVPVGVFLSGGIDSGLIAALAARAGGTAPLALTVGFSEADADESDLARASATHAGLDHRVVRQPMSGLLDLDRLAWFYDEPFGDPSALPTFTLCEAAAGQATVFLSGDGGDEAFAGYRRVVEGLRRSRLIAAAGPAGPLLRGLARCVPELSRARHRLLKLGLADSGAAAAFDALPGDPAMAAAAHPRLRPLLAGAGAPLWERWARSRGAALTARQQDLDYRLCLPDDLMVKTDRASMAHSIEVRSPFLDVRLIEWAGRLPRGSLLDGRTGKLPLRALAGRLLPRSVQTGVKRGFGVPLDAWFRTPAGLGLIRDRLLAPTALGHAFWDRAGVERLAALAQSPRGRDVGTLLWRLLMLEAWTRQHAAAGAPPAVGADTGPTRWAARASRR